MIKGGWENLDFTQTDSALCWGQACHSTKGGCAAMAMSLPTAFCAHTTNTCTSQDFFPFLPGIRQNSCASPLFSFYRPPNAKNSQIYIQIMHLETSPCFWYWTDLGFEYIVPWKFFELLEGVRRKRKLSRKRNIIGDEISGLFRGSIAIDVSISFFAWETQP